MRPRTSPNLSRSNSNNNNNNNNNKSRILDGFKNATYTDCINIKDDDIKEDNNNQPKLSSLQSRKSSNNDLHNNNSNKSILQQDQRIVDVDTINHDNFWNCRLSKKKSGWGTEQRSKSNLMIDDKFKYGKFASNWKVSTEEGSCSSRINLVSTIHKYDTPPPGEYIPQDYVISKQERFPSYSVTGRNFMPLEETEKFTDLKGELVIIQSKTASPTTSPIRPSSAFASTIRTTTIGNPKKEVPPRMPQPNPFLTPTPPPGAYDIQPSIEEMTKYERPGSVKMTNSSSKQRLTLDFNSLNINESLQDQKSYLPGPMTYTKSFSKYLYKNSPKIKLSDRYESSMYSVDHIKPGPCDYDVTKVYASNILSPTSRLTRLRKTEPVVFKKEPLFKPKRDHINIIANTERHLINQRAAGLNKYCPIVGPFYLKE